MKRWVILVIVVLGLAIGGCSLKPGVDFKPDGPYPRPLYKDPAHIWFSWYGYKQPTAEQAKQSQQESWWGSEVPYIPAQ
jgi:hypothetical protein